LKSERISRRNYRTREEARADIVEYITMFYNSRRLHSHPDYQCPDEFAEKWPTGQCDLTRRPISLDHASL